MSRHLEADTYIPANPETGDRARIVATIPHRHTDRCVCSECLRSKFPDVIGISVNDALAVERSRPKPRTLTLSQVHKLDTLAKRWNEDRARRGLTPIDADDVLTKGLQALIDLVTEGAQE
jgi:hypothetical protein